MKSTDHHLPANSALVHFETFAKIEDQRTKKLFTPKANSFQRKMFAAYETLLAVMLDVDFEFEIRILGLKIRQCGGTTAANHILYHHSQRFVTDSVLMTNVNANSKEVLRRMKLLGENDRYPWGHTFEAVNNQLIWSHGSRADITSAEVTNPGISRTRQAALFSEAAKYPRGGVKDDKNIMASVLPSLNQLGIAETTPEGASGWFFEQWHGTKDMPGALNLADFIAELKRGNRKPGNGWVKVFSAWFEFAENSRSVSPTEAERIQRTLTPRERNGIERYGWTPEQIAWRRDILFSECGGSEDCFDEFYPEDEVTCFLASGRPRFNMGSIMTLERRLPSRQWEEGNLVPQDFGGATFIPDASGYAPFRILERPRTGCRYIVWCDPATGEDQTESANPDRHSVGVLRAGYADPSGQWHNHAVVARCRPPFTAEGDIVIERIARLSAYYGDALVVLEVNMGLHILKGLKDIGVPLFRREVTDPTDRETPKLLYGWKLKDRDQRREVIVCLASHLRDNAIDIACTHIIGELKTFVIDKNGKEQARSGCHDDDVLGLGMALVCVGSATLYQGPVRPRRKPADYHKWKRRP